MYWVPMFEIYPFCSLEEVDSAGQDDKVRRNICYGLFGMQFLLCITCIAIYLRR